MAGASPDAMKAAAAAEGGAGSLAGRTIQVVTDIALEEQLYLYERARRLKAKHCGCAAGPDAPPLCEVLDADVPEKVGVPDATVYLIFMEGSTRTRESLRNAATFHGVKVNEFQAETSSFQKNETMTDTMKMLSVYSTERSVFVLRSRIEGVCRWLQTVLPAHADRFGIPRPAFLNAGDGLYSHPLGELVDVFSLLEHVQWDRSVLRIALVGDLLHGRTAHSKVDGLKVFRDVHVDLVAPEAFAYPVEYRNKMRSNGFTVREFGSVEEYLSSAADSIATIWYFYKPQFQRCGEITQGQKNELRSMVSMRAEWLSRLPPKACFFQTLPRDKEHPVVPLAFDGLPLNGWDTVANNAYFVDIVLLSMLFGRLGRGLPEAAQLPPEPGAESQQSTLCPFVGPLQGVQLPRFIEAVELSKEHVRRPERVRPGGAMPIADGLVIDHVGTGCDSATTWRLLRMVRTILGWSKHPGSEGVYSSSGKPGMVKGILSMPNFDVAGITVPQMKTLASIAPGCTINAIAGSAVVGKYRLHTPERIYNLPNISCKNKLCVSNPENKQRDVVAFFERTAFYETSALPGCKAAEYLYICKYCQWPHQYADIWTDSKANHRLPNL